MTRIDLDGDVARIEGMAATGDWRGVHDLACDVLSRLDAARDAFRMVAESSAEASVSWDLLTDSEREDRGRNARGAVARLRG